ncbi:ABC transporter substrate binding protein [Colwellia sp. UCD-KL20]|uniref:ABC transporter substrate binding protein n=1 Tax=Colwellia sp. UCD-KL20 TaxID=1917165 RepID=UPI000970FDD7|nr:ABC transporter substrate binding protein [Colwellia sp. UCD-KL20]
MTHIKSILNYFFLLSLLFLSNYSFSNTINKVTVIYPDINAPYDKIFSQIIEGIRSEFKGEVITLKLPRTFDRQKVFKNISTKKIIALGKRGMSIVKDIYQEKSVVVGAFPLMPNKISGVSLMASPTALFNSLHELAPQVKVINVVYSKSSAWLMEEAKEEAKNKGITLKAIPVEDIKMAVQAYNDLFENTKSKNVAIWLPLDPITANEKIIVPTILEKAWEKKIVVFSSKPTHAKRGALFSALPDNESLGKQLVALMKTVNNNNNVSVVKPLNTIQLAVNLRTAAHLGYNYQPSMVSDFTLIFPK